MRDQKKDKFVLVICLCIKHTVTVAELEVLLLYPSITNSKGLYVSSEVWSGTQLNL